MHLAEQIADRVESLGVHLPDGDRTVVGRMIIRVCSPLALAYQLSGEGQEGRHAFTDTVALCGQLLKDKPTDELPPQSGRLRTRNPTPLRMLVEPRRAHVARRAVLWVFVEQPSSMFMFSLNQTVLATALPTIVGELDGWDSMLWVSTAFMLASTATMPAYGKVGDLFGRKLFLVAISIFILGSVIALFADSMAMLITGRVFQGLGEEGS